MISQLGYLGFEVSDVGAWEAFATRVLGLAVARRREEGASLRMDRRAHRLLLQRGPADDLAFVGWEVGERDFPAIVDRLRRAGVEITLGDAADCARRGVGGLARFRDPGGLVNEIFHGPAIADEAFHSPLVASGFVADDLGLGHAALGVADLDRARAFYGEVLGFRLSDRIVADVHGYHADMVFLRVNRRHHSLALGARANKNMFHFMLEVGSVDDVGLAFDRALAAGARITQTLGRHPNDRMLSFYARTPSGFEVEIGWGGRLVDDATWQPATYERISDWGHHPPGMLTPRRSER
jgi:2,3-dihydroxybiphenyl 1,2-dioxygenase